MKSKTSNKRAKLVAILLVLVMLISVGYAALETLLQISGTATLKKKTWNVHFANVQVKTGSVQATTAPTVPEGSTDTTSLTWAVNMDTPGQYYEFNVDVVNGGDLDAMVSTATNSIITSTLTEAQRAYLDYTIKYENGAEVEQYDALPAGETRTITVKLLFKQDINPNVLPGTNQTGLTLSYNANYVQADSNVNTQKQTAVQYAVTFKDEDGTDLKTVQVNKGGTASYGEENPTKAQDANYTYEFSKWVTEQGGNTEATLANITEAKTVYASYTATAIPVVYPEIGSTVNYSTTLNGQTLNNWKVFYNDEANGYTYIILDDYLPNSAVPAFTGKQTSGTYAVNTNTNRADLINGLSDKANYDSLLTGTLTVNGETKQINETRTANVWAMGAPTLELWVNSWNTSYPSDTLYARYENPVSGQSYDGWYIGKDNAQTTSTVVGLSSKTGYSNTLYYPHNSSYGNCYGYWLASPSAQNDASVIYVACYGSVCYDVYNSNIYYVARPIVCLPSNILQ